MARRIIVSVVFVLIALGASSFWPVVLTYTFVAGEKGTAHVAECHKKRQGRSTLVCTGTWRTESGKNGSGEIYGLDRDQVGDSVPIRIGPMGPYAGGFGHSWPLFLTGIPAVVTPPLVVVLFVVFFGRGRKLAQAILDEPGDGLVLFVSRRAVTRADGSPYASARTVTSPPAGYRRLDLPGRPKRQHERSVFDAAAGIGKDATDFTEVSGPAGETLMFVEYHGSSTHEPEYVVLDAAGAPRSVIRRLAPHELCYSLLAPDGQRIGSAKSTEKLNVSMLVRDAGGTPVAKAALKGSRWVVRIEKQASTLLRDTTVALLLCLFRTD